MTDDRYELADEDVASLITRLRDVVFRTRGKAYWTYLSPAWSTLMGYSVEESLGRHILEFVHPDDREQNDDVKERLETMNADPSSSAGLPAMGTWNQANPTAITIRISRNATRP